MTNTSKNPAGAGSDDPWEQLAEDLFGLEYGKEHSAGSTGEPPAPEAARTPPVEEPGPALDTIEFAPEPVSAEPVRESAPVFDKPAEEPRAEVAAAPSPQDSYWDALANWNWDDGEGSGTRGKRPERREEPREERRSGDRPREESRAAPSAPRSSEPRTTESRTSEPRPAERASPPPRRESTEPRRGGPRAGKVDFEEETASEEPVWGDVPESRPPVSDASDAEADDDFGAIDDEEESEVQEAGGEQGTEGGRDEGGPRKRRRRRRRRRTRQGEPDTPVSGGSPAPSAGEVPGSDWDDEDAPAAAAPPPEAPRTAPPARSDRDRDRKREDDGPRRSRRRRGDRDRGDREPRGDREQRGDRDRGRREPAPVAESTEPPDDEFSSGLDEVLISSPGASPGDFDADDDEAEANISYEDVPTWEEAISYLLHPNQVQVEGAGGGSNASRGAPPPVADQPRQTRHYGGRRR